MKIPICEVKYISSTLQKCYFIDQSKFSYLSSYLYNNILILISYEFRIYQLEIPYSTIIGCQCANHRIVLSMDDNKIKRSKAISCGIQHSSLKILVKTQLQHFRTFHENGEKFFSRLFTLQSLLIINKNLSQ